jgi:polar amino acid transport system substrate-binding protein
MAFFDHAAFGPIARRLCAVAAGLCVLLIATSAAMAGADETGPDAPLRVAVYDVEPYGGKGHDGLFNGASVDLWRRIAEAQNWRYELSLVPRMDDVLSGLQGNVYDLAIGAITITPERLARVDFSYPTHRSGVAAVFAKQAGASFALYEYGAAVGEIGPLIFATVVFLAVTGILMWWFERLPVHDLNKPDAHSAVTSWHEGVYWAVVTMTTVGYGDKTPKTHAGRVIAVVWMIGSLVLVSLLTTTLIARITVNRVEGVVVNHSRDLTGKRLAAVSGSSGAEYLEAQNLPYQKFANLPDALGALAKGKTDAVINSVGALQYLVRTRFAETIAPPRGQLAPAYMAFALPANSGLKKSLDRALTTVTASPEWRSIEETYFGQ